VTPGEEMARKARSKTCWMCRAKKRTVRVMRRHGEGDQAFNDPDYAIRICNRCDTAT
jgi:hypothetical protein